VRRTVPVDDRGESLIELLVALVIMSTAVIAVVGGLGTAILMSDIHRRQAAIAAHLNDYAAAIQASVAGSPGYVECANEKSYPSYSAGPEYTAVIVPPVQFGYGTVFNPSCTHGGDPGVQRLTLRVSSVDGRVVRSMDIIVRKPCRPTEALCG
jgi:Tfp pilus assembly protein PilV